MKKKLNKCNLCQGSTFKFYLHSPKTDQIKVEKYGTSSQHVGGETLVQCQNCGLVFQNPQPDARTLLISYKKSEGETYFKDTAGRKKTFAGNLKLLQKFKSSGKLLDVGCAAGFFLEAAKNEGYEVTGIEPNTILSNWGRQNLKLNILNTTFEKSRFPNNFFNIITFWDVLEHLHDPMNALLLTNRILKVGGLVIINYPNIDSFWAKLLGRHWWFVVSHHLFYFSPKTLGRMLIQAGFLVLENKNNVQYLSLGYLLSRLGRYNENLALKLEEIVNQLLIGKTEVPYWAGQNLLIAKKQHT